MHLTALVSSFLGFAMFVPLAGAVIPDSPETTAIEFAKAVHRGDAKQLAEAGYWDPEAVLYELHAGDVDVPELPDRAPKREQAVLGLLKKALPGAYDVQVKSTLRKTDTVTTYSVVLKDKGDRGNKPVLTAEVRCFRNICKVFQPVLLATQAAFRKPDPSLGQTRFVCGTEGNELTVGVFERADRKLLAIFDSHDRVEKVWAADATDARRGSRAIIVFDNAISLWINPDDQRDAFIRYPERWMAPIKSQAITRGSGRQKIDCSLKGTAADIWTKPAEKPRCSAGQNGAPIDVKDAAFIKECVDAAK